LRPLQKPSREPATRRITSVSMRARARIALVLMALCASFGLAGCAAIEEEAFLRWVESEKLPPAGRGPFADDLPDATPVIPPEKPLKKEASADKAGQIRPNCNGRRPLLCFLKRNQRSRPPPRRRSRKAPRVNPRRLRQSRRSCLVAGPKHRHPDVFHAD
jgi:hypothetical protein